ncbi:hypothetical protein BV22DRAFT_1135425, partial [Leucogyrophana mollusca]
MPQRPATMSEEDFQDDIDKVTSLDQDQSDAENSDAELDEFRCVMCLPAEGASIEQYREVSAILSTSNANTNADTTKSYEAIQKSYMKLRSAYRELQNKYRQLEASQPKRRKKLTARDLAVATQDEMIRQLGRKFSFVRCLWISPTIFKHKTPPSVNLLGKDRWASPKSIEDGMVAELFAFVPPELHPYMIHDHFAQVFSSAVSAVRSEAVSDVKNCGGIIFGLDPELFLRGVNCMENAECQGLLMVNGKYTKFAPVLFANPAKPATADFLKGERLVKVLKVALFGKTALAKVSAPHPKVKATLWDLRSTTAGMISAAAVIAIFLLSGDKEFAEVGNLTGIPYRDYHNYFREFLLTGGDLAQQVYTFFNNALFPGSSGSTATSTDSTANSWDDNFERALRDGVPAPTLNDNHFPVPHSAPASVVTLAPQADEDTQSISAALQHPDVGIQGPLQQLSITNGLYAPVEPAPDAVAKPKPKARQRAPVPEATTPITENEAGSTTLERACAHSSPASRLCAAGSRGNADSSHNQGPPPQLVALAPAKATHRLHAPSPTLLTILLMLVNYKLHGSTRPISMKSNVIRKRSHHDARRAGPDASETPSASPGASRRPSPTLEPSPTLAPDSTTQPSYDYTEESEMHSTPFGLMGALGQDTSQNGGGSGVYSARGMFAAAFNPFPGPYHPDYLSQNYAPLPADALPFSSIHTPQGLPLPKACPSPTRAHLCPPRPAPPRPTHARAPQGPAPPRP